MRRIILTLLTGIICAFLGVFAVATPVSAGEISLNIRIEGPVDTIVAVKDYAIETEDNENTVTAGKAFQQVLKDSNIKNECYTDYCYFSKIGNYAESRINGYYIGWSYGINGKPIDNTRKNVKVANGDDLVLYYADMNRAFPDYYLEIGDDSSVTLTFSYSGDDSNGDSVTGAPLSNATVYWDGRKFTTDNSGRVVIPSAYAAGGSHSIQVERYLPGVTLATGEPCPNVLRYPAGKTVEYINFIDLSSAQWARTYIYNLVYRGVINGISADTFCPTENLTRAELVKMLCTIRGDDVNGYKGYSYFEDVAPGQWYAPYVNWAKDQNVTTGTSPETFGPDEPITREDFVTMLYRFTMTNGVNLGDNGKEANFADAGSISEHAVAAVSALCKADIINGYYEAGVFVFKPKAFTTRAEGAKMLSLYCSNYFDKK
ncbi:MAG: S-layer homology domain-containing protein [Bacillota bacterium]|nr:S-layer homology domain-containing protein [Bacillota bacterium]